MDQEKCEKAAELKENPVESKMAVPTPQKNNEPLRKEVKLPEHFEIFVELFNRMNCSLRLLGLRKKLATFDNVSAQVEVMMKRKFLYSHLAQLKYIMPEAIQIDKIFVQDGKTSFMKPEMKVMLQFDAIEKNSGQSTDMALQELFVSRLVDFLNLYPEACDIPEATLPEPFNRSIRALSQEDTNGESTIAHQLTSSKPESLRRHFSLLGKSVSSSAHCDQNSSETKSSPGKDIDRMLSESDGAKGLNICYEQEKDTNSHGVRGPDISCEQEEEALHSCYKSSTTTQTPAVKSTSFNGNSMIETPVQMIPQRPESPNGEKNSKCTGNKECTLSSFKPAKRSLNFSGLEDDEVQLSSPCKDNSLDVQVQNTQTLETLEEITFHPTVALNKEIISLVKDEKSSSTKPGMCQQQSSCLPDIVSNICSIFRTVGYSSITKDELVHKIIMNSFEITDRKEVEEKVELLEKLVPDWIYRKKMLSGDVMYSINKKTDMESIILSVCN